MAQNQNQWSPLSSLAGQNAASKVMGVQAKAPAQNLAQPANTIQPQWQKDLATVQSKLKPQVNVPITPKTGIMQSLVNPQPPAPVPTTALKKDVAGNEYHAPATPAVAPPATPADNQPKPVDTSYGGIMGGLVSKASQPTVDYIAQQAEANRINQQMEEAKAQMAKQTSDINQSGTWTSRALGEQGQANIQNAGTLAALGSQYQGAVGQMGAANTQQGLQQQGLQGAAGLTPEALRYGDTAGGLSPAVQANNYTQDVLSGKRSYADAVSAMGLYGNAGKQFLDQAIRSQQPDYNFAQAATLGAGQGAVAPAYDFASKALTNVESLMKNLGFAQGTNVPAVNAVGNAFSGVTGIGSEQTRAVTGAVQTLRNAYASLLASAKGGTPSDFGSQAIAEIPNNPTPNDIAAIRKNFENLGTVRKEIYGAPGTTTNTSSSKVETNSDGTLKAVSF